jgi:hypothetical protein
MYVRGNGRGRDGEEERVVLGENGKVVLGVREEGAGGCRHGGYVNEGPEPAEDRGNAELRSLLRQLSEV